MRIFTELTLLDFSKAHVDAASALRAWYAEVSHVEWRSMRDVKRRYPTASILRGSRVVFNVKGNRYRIVTSIDFSRQAVFIRFLGTHAEYDKIDAVTV